MKAAILIGVIIFTLEQPYSLTAERPEWILIDPPAEQAYWFTQEFKDYGFLNMTACQAHKRHLQKTIKRPNQLSCS